MKIRKPSKVGTSYSSHFIFVILKLEVKELEGGKDIY